ncbi:MAG: ESX secretion-associated protein EspG [Kibdelosporangium sp.]
MTRLSEAAFLVLTERLGIQVPTAIRVLPTGFHRDERRAEVEGAVAELDRLGLLNPQGDIDDRLAGRLRILDQADHIVDVVARVDSPANAVIAANGRRAVLIIHSGQQMAVRQARPVGLGEQAAQLMPGVPAGYGRSVSVPTETLQKAAAEAGEDIRSLETALQRHGVARDIAHMIAVMNEGPTIQMAQFGVTTKDRTGRWRRGDRVIGWWRNESGGYLTEEHFSSSGESWTSIAPTDLRRLATQVDRMLTEAD